MATPDPAPSNWWAIAAFTIGLAVTMVGLVTLSRALTVPGPIVGALGGSIWRYRIRRARAHQSLRAPARPTAPSPTAGRCCGSVVS